MKRIIGILKPLEVYQKFLIFENNQKIEEKKYNIVVLPAKVVSLAKTYEITQIDLIGPKAYTQKIANAITSSEQQTYEENTIKINLI